MLRKTTPTKTKYKDLFPSHFIQIPVEKKRSDEHSEFPDCLFFSDGSLGTLFSIVYILKDITIVVDLM
jgi:hypothetical protein